MTAMATLWQANDGFRPIGALFFEMNGNFHYMFSISAVHSQKLLRLTHGNLHEISNKFLRNLTV